MATEPYIKELEKELEHHAMHGHGEDSHAYKILQEEIARVKAFNPSLDFSENNKYTPRTLGGEEIITLSEKVFFPVREHPKFNFIGKLLGPQGNTLKRLQQQTQTRMNIQGKGSGKDRKKEEELREGGDEKYAHLKEDLHVFISVKAPKAEAHGRLAAALKEIKPYLRPEREDQISKDQMRELAAIKGGYEMGDEEEEEEEERPPIRGGQQIIYPGGQIPKNLPPGAIIIQVPADGQARNPNPRFTPYGTKKKIPAGGKYDDQYARISR